MYTQSHLVFKLILGTINSYDMHHSTTYLLPVQNHRNSLLETIEPRNCHEDYV